MKIVSGLARSETVEGSIFHPGDERLPLVATECDEFAIWIR